MKMKTFGIIVRILLPSTILIIALYFLIIQAETPEPIKPSTQLTIESAIQIETSTPEPPEPEHYQATVTRIIDADTLLVDNTTIRLALVDAPEYYEDKGKEAKEFISNICPIGSTAIIDEDQGQTAGSYGRVIAVVYCNKRNLNAELINNNYGIIDKRFCNVSEFANEDWAEGC